METHLLIVDDDKDLCALLGVYFKHNGYQVTTANSDSDARALLKRNRFDLALLDWNLNGTPALALLKLMQKRDPATPIIIFTGVDAPDETLLNAIAGRASLYRKNYSLQSLALEVHLRAQKRHESCFAM